MIRSSVLRLTRATREVIGCKFKDTSPHNRTISTVQFDWTDAFNLESQLTEEEILMRDQVKSYCQQKLMPRILEANRHEKPDHGVLKEMGDLGILGPTINGLLKSSIDSITISLPANNYAYMYYYYKNADRVDAIHFFKI